MKALIVGGSGHLGAHLARALLSRGMEARVLVRPTSNTLGLGGLNLDLISGDVLDPASLRRAMPGCDHVYHLAAPTNLDPATVNVILDGTRAVLEEAARAGTARVVLTSSTVTVGYSADPSIVLDENARQQSFATPYHSAKWAAEQAAFEFARQSGLPVVIVNPSSVVGSLDFRVTPSNAPIQRCLDRGLPIAFHGGITIAHAADVAIGHILAMERGVPGRRYILGGERLSLPDYFAMIAGICGRREPLFVVPRWAILGAGAAFSVARRLGMGSAPFSYGQIRNVAGYYAWYSSERAQSELGYRWRPAAEAIKDYVDWVESGRPVTGLAT